MTEELHIVSKDRHLSKKWLKWTGHGFAASIPTAQIAGEELAECSRSFPLCFFEQQGTQTLVALLGLLAGQNLFVAPDGRWLGRYVPAVLRAYPFRLAETDNDALALCVDEQSGLVQDLTVGAEGIPFFDEDGKPHPETQKMADFLTLTHRGIHMVQKGAALLAELDLLEPWPLKVMENEVEKTVTGISRINEKKLSTISGEDLVKLRDGNALAIAYGQLLSMGNISILGTLAQHHNQNANAKAAKMTIPEGSFATDDGNLKIDWNTFLKD